MVGGFARHVTGLREELHYVRLIRPPGGQVSKRSGTTIKKFLHHCRRVSPPRASLCFFPPEIFSLFAPEPFNFYLSPTTTTATSTARPSSGCKNNLHPQHQQHPASHSLTTASPPHHFAVLIRPPHHTTSSLHTSRHLVISPRLTLISQCINYPRPNTCTINTGSPPSPPASLPTCPATGLGWGRRGRGLAHTRTRAANSTSPPPSPYFFLFFFTPCLLFTLFLTPPLFAPYLFPPPSHLSPTVCLLHSPPFSLSLCLAVASAGWSLSPATEL